MAAVGAVTERDGGDFEQLLLRRLNACQAEPPPPFVPPSFSAIVDT
jgi:hypothetical protein